MNAESRPPKGAASTSESNTANATRTNGIALNPSHGDTADSTRCIPDNARADDPMRAAFALAKAGLYVLPVRKGTKHPGSVVGAGWPTKSSRDVEQVVGWFAGTDYGLAIHAGRSGLVIFDVDDPENVPEVLRRHLDSMPFQSTRSNVPGRGHYLALMPEGRNLGNGTGGLGKGWGEVRGHNGVIVVGPSAHEKADEGGQYKWERIGPILPLPAEIVQLLPAGDASPENTATDAEVAVFLAEHVREDDPAMLRGVLTKFEDEAAQGSRHDACVSALCWAMREAANGAYSASNATDALRAAFVAKIGTERNAAREFEGILAWAVGQVPRPPARPVVEPKSLDDLAATFRRWLGDEHDMDVTHAVAAAAATDQLDGDPVWLLVVSAPGDAKTERVASLAGSGAHITSTITSEGALLSATSRKERSKDATGGLLRKIGPSGVLVLKDFTSILSMSRDQRAAVLAALREVYDGKWERNVGSDGGQTLTWQGRITVIGAVTSAYDSAHGVISAMGDRFALIRGDSTKARMQAGRQAMRNTGHEVQMRAELSEAMAGVLAQVDVSRAVVTDEDHDALLRSADLVTRTRTAVERDFKGDVIDAHQPEMPTRFAKMLGQIMRGAMSIGFEHDEALRLARRVARDSMPPMRLSLLEIVAEHPGLIVADYVRLAQKPRSSVDRVLQELHVLGLLEQRGGGGGMAGSPWTYRLADGVDLAPLSLTRNVTTPGHGYEKTVPLGTAISGYASSSATAATASGGVDDPF